MSLNRRQFLAASAALGATASIAAPTSPLPFLIQMQSDPLLPKAKGKRVVICGGGWGGVTAAKHLKKLDPTLEVVLLERNPVFFSCPMSNKWLVDVVDAQFLTFSYLDVARSTATTSSRPKSPPSSATGSASSPPRAGSITTT
jgi:hypothetical protein